jgi:hypothetical protein
MLENKKFYPVILPRRAKSSPKPKSVQSSISTDSNRNSLTLINLDLKYNHIIKIDHNLNLKSHSEKWSKIHNTQNSSGIKSKLVDLKREYFTRSAYNQLRGTNEKNLRPKHNYINVYSTVNQNRDFDNESFNYVEVNNKYFIENHDEEIFDRPHKNASSPSNCNYIVWHDCFDCKANNERIMAKKRSLLVKPNQNENKIRTINLKSAKSTPIYDIVLPINFFNKFQHNLESRSKIKSYSSLLKNTDSLEYFEYDYEIKPDSTLWNIQPQAV